MKLNKKNTLNTDFLRRHDLTFWKEHFKVLWTIFLVYFNAVKLMKVEWQLTIWRFCILSMSYPGYIQASRALMITAIVCGTFGLAAALIGLQCSKAGGENYVLKGRIAGTAGVLFILQGNTKKSKECHLGEGTLMNWVKHAGEWYLSKVLWIIASLSE